MNTIRIRWVRALSKHAGNCCKIPKEMQFAWFPREMLESVAFRALSGNALKSLNRLSVEMLAHSGTVNGDLVTTHRDFAEYGIRYASIPQAIRELEYMGFIRVKKGWAFRGENIPNKYRLTWYATPDGVLATNEWKRMKASDSRECRNCHDFESMSLAYQRPRARKQHQFALKEALQLTRRFLSVRRLLASLLPAKDPCAGCHRNSGGGLPLRRSPSLRLVPRPPRSHRRILFPENP